MTDMPVVVSAEVASNSAASGELKRPLTYIGTAANADPTIQASATMTMPCAHDSVRRVARKRSVSAPTRRHVPEPSARAASALCSPRTAARTAGSSISSPRPLRTLPR